MIIILMKMIRITAEEKGGKCRWKGKFERRRLEKESEGKEDSEESEEVY